MLRSAIPIALAACALGCEALGFYATPEVPEPPPDIKHVSLLTPEERAVAVEYGGTIDRVAAMVADPSLRTEAQKRGLALVDLTWEDTGRAQGSVLGPNISDLTLQVRRRDPHGRWADALMPVVRYPNFTDRTGDVPADRFFVRAGNERGAALATVPLAEVLRDLRRFTTAPATLGLDDSQASLLAERDTHFLVSAQAVFLPLVTASAPARSPTVLAFQRRSASPWVVER